MACVFAIVHAALCWLPVVQVKHRCKCNKQEACGEEEAAVIKAAEEGRIANNYVLP